MRRPLATMFAQGPGASLAAQNLRGTLLMIVSTAAFLCNDTAMKFVTQSLPLYQSVAIRGTVVLALVVLAGRVLNGGMSLRVPRRDLRVLILRTMAEIATTVLYLVALRQMALADLTAITQALPLTVTLAAAVLFREPLGWPRLAAIGVGFVGVLLILRPGTGAFDGWSLVALASMALVVVRDISTRFFSAAVGSSTIAFFSALGVLGTGFVLGLTEEWRMPSLSQLALLGLAAIFLAVGYVTAVATMRVGEISFVAPFRYTALIWAILLGLVVFGEWPDGWTWAGSALVTGAGLLTILRERRLMGRI